MIYILAFLFSLLFCWCSTHSKKEAKWITYFISTIPLTLLSAFRYNIGTDYQQTYEPGFIAIRNGFDVDGYDWGFTLLNKAILLITPNPQWLFIITSIIISYFIFKAIRKVSPNLIFSFYLYFCSGMYFMGMNQLKQFLGMSICLYAIHLFIKQKYILFILSIVIAGSFHTVNYIFILPFIINKIVKINSFIKPINIIILLILTYIIANVLIGFFFNEILVFTRFYDRYNESTFVEANFSIAYFALNLYALSIYFYTYKKNKDNSLYTLFYVFKILSTFLVLLSGQMMIVARLSDTYLITDILFIPYVISKINNKLVKTIITLGVVSLYGYYWYWSIYTLNNHECYPYQFRLP